MKDMRLQAAHVGFKMGECVELKKAKQAKIYKITELSAEKATLTEVTEKAKPEIESVPYNTLMTSWKIKKLKLSEELVRTSWLGPLESKAMAYEITKGVIFQAMRNVYELHTGDLNKICVFTKPGAHVKTTEHCPVKSLTLVGASLRLERKSSGASITVGKYPIVGDTVEFFANPHFTAPDGSVATAAWVVPFWTVQTCSDKSAGNMVIDWKQNVVGDITVHVPVLTNHVALKKGHTLVRFKGGEPLALPEAKRRKAT